MDAKSIFTDDSLFAGELVCRQKRAGYRFSVDSILLAHFALPLSADSLLDLGCGCGVIGLLVAHQQKDVQITGLELQPHMVDLSRNNIEINGFAERFKTVAGDVRDIRSLLPAESFSAVVCNPPYGQPGRGRLNSNREVATARHELAGNLSDFLAGAAFVLKNKGSLFLVYPARGFSYLLASLASRNLIVKKIRMVFSYPEAPKAKLVLLELVKNGGLETAILSPLFIYKQKNGPYSQEMEMIYRG